jgi:hypothetical protein
MGGLKPVDIVHWVLGATGASLLWMLRRNSPMLLSGGNEVI